MYNVNKSRIKAVIITIVYVLLIATTAVFAATTPVVNSISRPKGSSSYGVFCMQGKSQPLSASISNYPTSVSFYWKDSYKASMYASNDSTGSWTPSSSDYYRGLYPFGSAYYTRPGNFKVSASNSAGTGTREIPGYVTRTNLSNYKNYESYFSYSSEYANQFRAVGTGYSAEYHGTLYTYNCLAYAVDIYYSWQWPVDWGSFNSISLNKMLKYMNGTESGSADGTRRTSGTFYYNGSTSWTPFKTKVIYYDNGHFAKVISYNSDGSPRRIMSKWGHWELIESYSYNPFTSTYGSPKYYFY